MGRHQREKGKRGERQWRDVLREAGFEAKRGQQFAGGAESPDVVCRELSRVHFEVKVGKAPPIYRALRQATLDGGPGKIPIVAARVDGDPEFFIACRAKVFLAVLRDGMEALGGPRPSLASNEQDIEEQNNANHC